MGYMSRRNRRNAGRDVAGLRDRRAGDYEQRNACCS